MLIRLTLTAVAILGFTVPSRGELLWFTAGGAVQLPAHLDGKSVAVEAPSGTIHFARSDFRRIVPGFNPAAEWPERRTKALAAGAPERFAAAWWALENGLVPEAEAMLREAHKADPAHQPTARLIPWLARFAKPINEPAPAARTAPDGSALDIARGAHVVLYHRHDPATAAERLEALDHIVEAFYLHFVAQGIDPKPLDRRLVAVWFARPDDYRAALRAEGAGDFLSTRGYYHPTKRIVFAYDWHSDPAMAEALAAVDRRRAELTDIAARLQSVPVGGRIAIAFDGKAPRTYGRDEAYAILDRHRRDLDRRALLLDLTCREINIGTAAHELVHQLVAVSGLAPRHESFPVWLHEGLAMQFEVVRGGRWAGIGRVNDLRLAAWRSITPSPALVPLVRDRDFGHGYRSRPYAEAWALVFFLQKEHPQAWRNWLDLLRRPDPDPDPARPAERAEATFRAAFGPDLISLESPWRRSINALRTPFDEGRVNPVVTRAVHSN